MSRLLTSFNSLSLLFRAQREAEAYSVNDFRDTLQDLYHTERSNCNKLPASFWQKIENTNVSLRELRGRRAGRGLWLLNGNLVVPIKDVRSFTSTLLRSKRSESLLERVILGHSWSALETRLPRSQVYNKAWLIIMLMTGDWNVEMRVEYKGSLLPEAWNDDHQ